MQQLTGHDANFLYADTVHSNANVSFVQIYDQSTAPGGKVRFKTILAHIESRLHRSPLFRNKLLRVPLELDLPYWVEDDSFDLEYHVRHIALPQPGDWRQLCIQASRIHARALDLQRPLWEIYVIEGLDSITDLPPGSFALLTKVHHAALDEKSRPHFTELLHDFTRKPPKVVPPEPWFPERAPGALALLSRASLHAALAPTKLLQPLLRAAPTALAFAHDWLHPEHPKTATRFNAVVSAHRVFDTRRFLRSEFDIIAQLVPGATLQDAVLAVCAGGLRRYLAAHSELPKADLAAQVQQPAALTQAQAAADPTRNGPGTLSRRIPFGTALADPVQRLDWIRRQTALPDSIEAQRSLPPPSCTVSHVDGPSAPVYLHGARMTYFSAILPIADGMGLVFAVTQYDGRIVISPTSCRELMPDPQAFTQCVRDSFQEYLALAQPVKPAAPRASTSGKPSPPGRKARSAAKSGVTGTSARRRSTAPSR